MAWFKWFKKPGTRAVNHTFDEEERELSWKRRKLNHELDEMRRRHEAEEERARHHLEMLEIQAEIKELQDATGDGSDSVEDKMAMVLIEKLMTSKPSAAPDVLKPTLERPAVTDAQLRDIWDSVPVEIRSRAPECSDDQIREFIKARVLPSADEATIDRALAYVRSAE